MENAIRRIKGSVELKECDYNALIDVVKETGKVDSILGKILLKVVKILPVRRKIALIEAGVEYFRNGICGKIQKIITKQGITAQLKDLKTIRDGEFLKISLEVENYRYGEIVELIIQELGGSEKMQKNEYISLVLPQISIVNQIIGETIPEALQDEIIQKMLNDSAVEICKLVSDLIRKQYKRDVLLENLRVE